MFYEQETGHTEGQTHGDRKKEFFHLLFTSQMPQNQVWMRPKPGATPPAMPLMWTAGTAALGFLVFSNYAMLISQILKYSIT